MSAAANPLRGQVTLPVGADTLILVFDANAFCIVEAALDMPTLDIVDRVTAGSADFRTLRALLWAAMSHHHPGSISDAGDVISRAGLAATRDALIAGLAAAFGIKITEDKEAADPPAPGQSGTG